MRASLVFACVILPGPARADVPISLHDGLLPRDEEPIVHVDPLALPNLLNLGANLDGEQLHTIALGRHSWLELGGAQWSDRRDFPMRGWSAELRFAYDLGPLTLSITGSENAMDSQFGGYRYRDLGISLGKTKRFSRWVTGWLALSLGRREWLGKPPDGEQNTDTIMLSVGATFK